MIYRICLFSLCILASCHIHAQVYKVDDIPEELKENAHAVFFEQEGVHKILAKEEAIYKVHYVIAILDKKAKSLASEVLHYGRDTKIKSFKGQVYNKYGVKVFTSTKGDIYDRSAVSGFSIYEDSRLKYLNLQQNEYPYIIEIDYELHFDMTFHMPSWTVLPESHVAVMSSEFSVIAPTDFKPNFKVVNSDSQLNIQEKDGKTHSSISFSNVKAIETEPYGPSINELSPAVWTSPTKLSYDGYEGSFNTWREMGIWQNQLNTGLDNLPEKTKSEIKALTEGLTNRSDKIRAVYEYMQNKTRYVSIQLGIGGWQPFPAATVDELGYGDCKALTNYTYSLLKAIDIPSYYTIVYAGKNFIPLDREFPRRISNHVILCVPNQSDTLWLECTSQTNPFGYQGSFTGGRDVLIVTPDGGKVVHTKAYGVKDNKQITKARFSISEDRSAKGSISIEYSGLQYENGNLNSLIDNGKEKLEKWIYNNTNVPDFRIIDFDFKLEKDKIPKISESLEIEIYALASNNGKRMFLTPNHLNKWTNTPKKVSDRKHELILSMAYEDYDSVSYDIPEKFHIEYLPKDVDIETEFGSYHASFSFEDHRLIYTRNVIRNKGRFPKEGYEAYRNFYKAVKKADHSKVVFIDRT